MHLPAWIALHTLFFVKTLYFTWLHQTLGLCVKGVPFVNKRYSLTSPYRHLYDTDTSLIYYGPFVWSQKSQKSYIPYLYNTDAPVKRTVGSGNFGVRIKEV